MPAPRRPCGLGLRFALWRDSGLAHHPRPRFGLRRNVPLRSLAAGAARARGGTKPPAVVSAFLSSGGVPPGAREDNADWQKRQPPAFPTHPPKSAERSRVLLSTAQSIALVSPTLNKAVSLLRENQDRSGTAFVIRVPRKPIPVLSSLRKPSALFSGRFRAARAWPLRLRLRRASLWSLRSVE